MFIYWALKRKQNRWLATLFFLVVFEGVGWGHDHPPLQGVQFLIITKNLKIPKAKTLGHNSLKVL